MHLTRTHRDPAGPRRPAAVAIALCMLLAITLAPASPAQAARDYEVEIMDDQLLLHQTEARVVRALREIRALGADRIRVSAFWRDIAPATNSTRRPSFDATNPRDAGTLYNWEHLDLVVAYADHMDLGVLISITGPGPLWASANPRRGRLWRPSPADFADFAEAVAGRYARLADRFAIWNEPNQGAWLQPQWACSGSSCIPASPHHYRRMVNAAYPRIKRAAPRSDVLIGELAPSGTRDRSATRPMRPLLFLREMACRTRSFRALRAARCRGFSPPRGDGIGHHPYTSLRSPRSRSPSRDDAAFGDTPRLLSTIDRLQRSGGLLRGSSRTHRFPLYFTEFGYQTNPPDPFSGVSLARQRLWLQDAAYLAWLLPRVRSLNQFRVVDGPLRTGRRRYVEFQSGLRFRSLARKPSYLAFMSPFYASATTVRRGGRVLFWGHARRASGRTAIAFERRLGRSWRRVAVTRTNARGAFHVRYPLRVSASYRYRYRDARGRVMTSAPRRVAVRGR